MKRARKEEEEKAPDTMPVPTPPLESGERNPDVTIIPRTPEMNRFVESVRENSYKPTFDKVRQRGYVRAPMKTKKATPAMRTVDEMLVEIEQKGGSVQPELVLIVLKSYRALEATNRALKEEMAKHVEELKKLKAKKAR